jgi:putative flippase GtrA
VAFKVMVLRQFLIYIAVGVVCATIDVGVMQSMIWCDVDCLVATTFGFAAGLVVNFFLHTGLTFRSRYSRRALMRFLVVVLINYIFTLLVVSLSNVIISSPLPGKLISLPLVAINGFFLCKLWVYRPGLSPSNGIAD